ncbi:16525_t:CDS:2, partial [Cetraspora pellucida]
AILILTLLPSPSTQLRQFTYEDSQTGLDLLDNDKSSDGTVILRFGYPISQVNGIKCWDKTIYLRIIHPNASISFFTISNHGIPDFNFCLKNNKTTADYTTIWGFDQGLMITYYNSSNLMTSAIMGLFINFEGTIIRFSESGIIQTNISIVTTSSFYVLEKGFAIAYGGEDLPVNLNQSTVDINRSTTNSAYIIFYYFETNTRIGPFILFRTPTQLSKSNNTQILTQTLTLRGIICNVEFNGAGNICWLLLISQYTANVNNNTTNNTNANNTSSQPVQNLALKISYLSSGSITKQGEMKNTSSYGYYIQPLLFGGYLMMVFEDNYIFGYILDENGDIYCDWSLPQPLNNTAYKMNYIMLGNNSIVIVENQTNSTWKVTSDDLFKFTSNDNKFNNPVVKSTNPNLGSQVNESTGQLHISFTYPIILSSSNISIYQKTIGSNNDLLRQRFQGVSANQFCQIDPNDNKTVIIKVFPSTFNEPNGFYYVVVEDNFVKRSDSNEALLGIDKNLWTLVNDQITGIIRLTPGGSSYYLSLNSDDQQKFHEKMATDLSNVIPVEDNRLTPMNGFEKDISSGTLQILLSFKILDTSDLLKKSSVNISQDFNTLLKYKKYSALMHYNTTSLIDDSYPMTIARNLVVLIVSTSINIISSTLIIAHEIGKNLKFSKWFSEYGFLLPFFTIISAGHIETLYVLSSKFLTLKIFSAHFSKTAENAIFWVGILGLIVGIPQFIIQVGI